MILLKGLFFIFVTGLIVVAAIVLSVVYKIYRLRQQLKQNGEQTWDNGQSQRKNGSTTVSDRRDPAKASRKIFSDEEGEYIDYEEEE